MDEEVTTDPYGLDTEEAPAELDSLARRPENAIDAADVVDGVLILKRHDGRELKIGAGEHGGAPDGGGSSGTLTVVPIDADRALLPSDIGCLLDAVGSTPITLDASDMSEFEEGQTFTVCGMTVNTAFGAIGQQVVQPFVIARFLGVLVAAPAPQVPPPPAAPTRLYQSDGVATADFWVDARDGYAHTTSDVRGAGQSSVQQYGQADGTGTFTVTTTNAEGVSGTLSLIAWAGGAGVLDLMLTGMKIERDAALVSKIGFFSKTAAPVAQPAHPTTIEEVIALLTALGLCQ